MKKLFTVIALGAAMLSASATTLWTGTCAFANYQVASGDRPVFNPTDFKDAVVGDRIIFNITNNTEDPEGWHQVEIWMYDGEKPAPRAIGTGVKVIPGMTSAEFTIDETILADLLAGESCAAGTGYIVRSIELTSFDGVIWEGECLCPDWVPNPPVTLQGSSFAMAEEGDQLIFTVSKIEAGQYAGLQIDEATTFDVGPFGTTDLAEGQTEVRFVLNAELLASLVTNGINITGMNIKLTKITLVKGNGEVPPVDDAIWSGNVVMGNWANPITISADKFGTVQAGNQLMFTYTDAFTDGETDAQISLKQNLAEGWAEMPSDLGEYGNYIHLTDGAGVAYFDINAEAAASINEYGLVIAGLNYTLTRVDLITEPVSDDAIWSGSFNPGDWLTSLAIDAAKFADVTEGTVLAFTVIDAVPSTEGANDGGAIVLREGDGLTELPCDVDFGNFLYFSTPSETVYFTVNAEAAAALKTDGLVVYGHGYTLTKVAYVESDAINSVINDTAAPRAVYNLQGIKVADSLNDVNATGIYISGGKKYMLK